VPSFRRRVAISVFATLAFGAPVLASSLLAAPAIAAQRLGDRALREGASGPDVAELQAKLAKAGFKVTGDGQFGADTTNAVKAFQRVANLPASGVVGKKTVAALNRALSAGAADVGSGGSGGSGGFDPSTAGTSNPSTAGTSNPSTAGTSNPSTAGTSNHSLGDRIPVRRGMSGHDIRVLQDFLRRAGVARVTVDGQFGKGTLRAVRSWERLAGRTVDDVVDAGDIDALRQQVGAGRISAVTPLRLAPGDLATVGPDGLAIAPATAPDVVKQIIAAGNVIATKPYRYGGGHGSWDDTGYDCSGSVSYALHGAGLLDSPLSSGDYFNWGLAGPGQWVTLYTKSSHIFMVVAGLRFDTSGRSIAGTRWQADMRSEDGYQVRHPEGL
jgi:peptidoglycan hydrolase-like protein with peptidoglycan-binding domain